MRRFILYLIYVSAFILGASMADAQTVKIRTEGGFATIPQLGLITTSDTTLHRKWSDTSYARKYFQNIFTDKQYFGDYIYSPRVNTDSIINKTANKTMIIGHVNSLSDRTNLAIAKSGEWFNSVGFNIALPIGNRQATFNASIDSTNSNNQFVMSVADGNAPYDPYSTYRVAAQGIVNRFTETATYQVQVSIRGVSFYPLKIIHTPYSKLFALYDSTGSGKFTFSSSTGKTTVGGASTADSSLMVEGGSHILGGFKVDGVATFGVSIDTAYTNAVSKITGGYGITATKNAKDYTIRVDSATLRSKFVPYSGANAAVNLGSQTLTTTGSGSFGALSGTTGILSDSVSVTSDITIGASNSATIVLGGTDGVYRTGENAIFERSGGLGINSAADVNIVVDNDNNGTNSFSIYAGNTTNQKYVLSEGSSFAHRFVGTAATNKLISFARAVDLSSANGTEVASIDTNGVITSTGLTSSGAISGTTGTLSSYLQFGAGSFGASRLYTDPTYGTVLVGSAGSSYNFSVARLDGTVFLRVKQGTSNVQVSGDFDVLGDSINATSATYYGGAISGTTGTYSGSGTFGGSASATSRFTVRNGLLANIAEFYNSRGTLQARIDSTGVAQFFGTTFLHGRTGTTMGQWTAVHDTTNDRYYMGFVGSLGGNIQLYANGTSSSRSHIFYSDGAFGSNGVIPSATTTYDLGRDSLRWDSLYVEDVSATGVYNATQGSGGTGVRLITTGINAPTISWRAGYLGSSGTLGGTMRMDSLSNLNIANIGANPHMVIRQTGMLAGLSGTAWTGIITGASPYLVLKNSAETDGSLVFTDADDTTQRGFITYGASSNNLSIGNSTATNIILDGSGNVILGSTSGTVYGTGTNDLGRYDNYWDSTFVTHLIASNAVRIGGDQSTTTRFSVKNGLLANATEWYNSGGTLIAKVDSNGAGSFTSRQFGNALTVSQNSVTDATSGHIRFLDNNGANQKSVYMRKNGTSLSILDNGTTAFAEFLYDTSGSTGKGRFRIGGSNTDAGVIEGRNKILSPNLLVLANYAGTTMAKVDSNGGATFNGITTIDSILEVRSNYIYLRRDNGDPYLRLLKGPAEIAQIATYSGSGSRGTISFYTAQGTTGALTNSARFDSLITLGATGEGHQSTTGKVQVKNGLYANITEWYNSSGSLISKIDSSANMTLNGSVNAYNLIASNNVTAAGSGSIGDAAGSVTSRFFVKNGLLANAILVHNSRNTQIAKIDSNGAATFNGLSSFDGSNSGTATIGAGDSVQVSVTGLTTSQVVVAAYYGTSATAPIKQIVVGYKRADGFTIYGDNGATVNYWISKK